MKKSNLRETKQIIYHLKGIDESYPKNVLLIEFEPLCQKLWAFLSNFGFFYDACSPNLVMSRDPRCKFRNFLFCPNYTFNIRKSHKISNGKALHFRSYQPETSRGMENTPPPVPLELKSRVLQLKIIYKENFQCNTDTH